MDEIKYNARAFARLGQSGAIFGVGAINLHDKYPLICLSADMSTPAGLDRFKRIFPNDFINVGIAEQNMLGIAAGMASEGFRPICVTQAAFISMRSFEMVRQYMGYMRSSIIAVGLSSGFALSFLGNTHYAIEDLSLMRAIPGMWVFSPADAGAAVKIFQKALELNQPTYIRLTAGLMPPIVYPDDYTYDPGKIQCISNNGKDAVIFATGSMVHQSFLATQLLKSENIGCTLYDVSCIKPIDTETIKKELNCNIIFSVEEHNIIGGLGSAIAEVMAENSGNAKLKRIGIKDTFSEVGEYEWLLDKHGLNSQNIAKTIKETILQCHL